MGGYIPAQFTKMQDRPIAKYQLQSNMPNTKAVVSLMQPNVMFERKFYKRKQDGMNYKDRKYPGIILVCTDPDGKKVFKKSGKRRCHWGEVTLPGDGKPYNIYAMSADG